ncbi:MAG: AMP-binding protein [Candidatus Binatales bacterium]
MSNDGSRNGNGNRNGAGRAAISMPALAETLSGRRILLTGGTGFLGKVFLYLLLRWHPELDRVYLLIRGDARSSHNRLRREILDSVALAPLREHLGNRFDSYVEEKLAVIPGDIADEDLAARAGETLKRGSIDAVVHCAGLVNFEASLEKALAANTIGVANVLKFCRKQGAAMMHVSTCYVAGNADGQRFEDDIPADWCPNGARNFSLQREIRDALGAVDRVLAESRDQSQLAELERDEDDQSSPRGAEGALEMRRKRWVEDRLKRIGQERARRLGWPNTYSYSKSLGEQLVLAARDEINVVVVRPSVIESALKDPFPGWNQGVNTSAPLTYMARRGYRFYPARAELVLDVIPVDLVAHAMVPILAALLLRRHQPIYQLGTSERNPLPMRRLVELTALANRREQNNGEGPMGRLARHLEAVVVSHSTYELASRTIPDLLKRAAGFASTAMGEGSPSARKIADRVNQFVEDTDLARSLVDVYRPYIQELVYTFHSANIRTLYAGLAPADARRHPFRPDQLDWHDYWLNVHMPGLRRHIFPQLDLHTRSRSRAVTRHKSLLEMLDRCAERFGPRPALIARTPSGDRITTTYRELRDRSYRGGLLLRMRGVKPGDRVLLIGENSPGWVLGYFAILNAGAVAVPLDHQISPDELAPICEIAAPRAALVSAAAGRRLDGAIKSLGEIAQIDLEELGRPFILRSRSPAPAAPDRKTLASIVFTSGTTGAPKGVMLTHGNFAAEVAMISRVFTLSGDDLLLSLLPLHHAFEFTCGMLLPLASGATVVYPLGIDAANLSRTLADVRPTALIGVPALWQAIHRRIVDEIESRGPFFHAAFDQLRDLNRRLDRDFHLNAGAVMFRDAHAALGGRLRLAVSGGAALPQWIAGFFNDLGIHLLEGYGLTEAAPVLSAAHPGDPLQAGSVGKALAGIELKLDRDGHRNGEAGEIGEVGEIVARGPNIMTGYYCNPAATAEVIRDGWLRTGDLGRLDEQGRLYIVGRAKEVIVDSGGNNIYIDELEEAYGHCPYLKELAVVGIKAGNAEQVAALVVPAYARGERRRAVEDQLRAHFEKIGAGLGPHKRIRILRFTDAELPRTRTRKVIRAEVAARLRAMIHGDGAKTAAATGEVESWLSDALAQVCGAQDVTPATRLVEDLGLDSLALAELSEHIAERAGRELTPEELSQIQSVADLQRMVSQGETRVRLPSYARFARPFTPVLPGLIRRIGAAGLRRAQHAGFESWLKPRIMGRGNIPFNRNLLVVSNHASHLDFGLIGYALGPIGEQMVVLAAADYFFNTPARRFIAANFTRLIPFDRERAQIESLEDALRELAAGRSVLMFPEGTRSVDGSLHEFKSGAGLLAIRSGCDVLPIHISGAHQVLGKGSLIPRRYPVEVRIGAVITNARLREAADNAEGTGAYRKAAEFMRESVIALAQPRARTPRPTVDATDSRPSEAADSGSANTIDSRSAADSRPSRKRRRERGAAAEN